MHTSRYQDADRGKVTCSGSDAVDEGIIYPRTYFEWQFVENPWAGDRSPELWLCKEGKRIVGQMAGVPVHLKVGNRILPASWIHDLLVHPDFRGRGIAHRLGAASAADNKIVLGLGMGVPTARVFQRMGCSDFGRIPVYARPIRPSEFLSRRLGQTLGSAFGFVAKLGLGLVASLNRAFCASGAIRLQEVDHFDERADEVWRAVARYYTVLCVRDARQLNWRFAAPLVKEHYARFLLLRCDTAIGYVVLSRETVNGIDAAIIVDYLCAPQDAAVLFSMCVDQCYQTGVAALFCTHLCPSSNWTMRRLGFLRRRKAGKWFIASVRGLDDATEQKIQCRSNWFATLADSDAHRPAGIRGKGLNTSFE